MKKTVKFMGLVFMTSLFIGCVPPPAPQSPIGTSIGTPIGNGTIAERLPTISKYGMKPRNYVSSIKNYFAVKLPRGERAKYKFGNPKRAYKRKGLAYGGDIAWRGWLVETLASTPNRAGRYLTPKPYMVLFSGEQIVEHILGNSHKLLVKVDQ